MLLSFGLPSQFSGVFLLSHSLPFLLATQVICQTPQKFLLHSETGAAHRNEGHGQRCFCRTAFGTSEKWMGPGLQGSKMKCKTIYMVSKQNYIYLVDTHIEIKSWGLWIYSFLLRWRFSPSKSMEAKTHTKLNPLPESNLPDTHRLNCLSLGPQLKKRSPNFGWKKMLPKLGQLNNWPHQEVHGMSSALVWLGGGSGSCWRC